MPQDTPTQILCDEAKENYGITCPHERMPNRELRFRLVSTDGSAYIRTVSALGSGWQRSHFHKQVFETYIVQSGWMALASLRNGDLMLEKFVAGEIITTERLVPHNVYLPANAVIHTVKHGNTAEKDWWPSPELDHRTTLLTEEDILLRAQMPTVADDLDPRFSSYIDVYNNLDSLIWQVPGFFIASAAIIFGFLTSSMSKESISLPPIVWACVFIFVGLLFLIGTYSMHRIRLHHTRMGSEIMLLEPSGYFHQRAKSVRRFWPPSAPHVFMVFFAALGVASLVAAYLVFTQHPWLLQLAQPK
jgi:hypothetical protein